MTGITITADNKNVFKSYCKPQIKFKEGLNLKVNEQKNKKFLCIKKKKVQK